MNMDSRIVTYADREQMIAARVFTVGASEVPAILGVEVDLDGAVFSSPYALWAQKCGLVPQPDLSDNEQVESGLALEAGILNWYAAKRNRKQPGMVSFVKPWNQSHRVRHPKYDWFRCTPDGLQNIGLGDDWSTGLCQVKNVSAWMEPLWRDGAPLPYQIQEQAEMAITGHKTATIIACIGGQKLVWFDYDRNDDFIAKMEAAAVEFWEQVQTRTPPAMDGTVWTASALAEQFKKCERHKVASLPWDMAAKVDELARLKKEISEREAEARRYENELKAAIGESGAGLLSDGRVVTWFPDSRGIRTLRVKKK